MTTRPVPDRLRAWLLGRVGGRVARRRTGSRSTGEPALVRTPRRHVGRAALPDGRPVIVKARRGRGSLARDAAGLHHAARRGVPAPNCVAYVAGSVDVLVVDDVGGEGLRSTHEPQRWRQAGRALRLLHDADPGPDAVAFGGHRSWGAFFVDRVESVARAVSGRGLADPAMVSHLVEWSTSTFAAMELDRPSWIHGDAMSKHVLFDADEQPWLIDFDVTGLGDPLFDVAVMSLWAPARAEDLLAGYGLSAVDADRYDDHIWAYQAVRLLNDLDWTARHGAAVRPVTDLLDDLDRRRRAGG